MKEEEKTLNIIFSVAGTIMGIVSYYIAVYYLAFLILIVVYAGCFSLAKFFGVHMKKILMNSLLPYFGFWFLVWVLLFNIL